VNLLRATLRWQAVLWAVTGLVLVAAPRWAIEGVLAQPPLGEEAWARLAGAAAIALAAQMVLVGRRIEDLWWWSWSFALLEVGVALICSLNALAGLADDAAAWPWWALAAVSAGFAALDLAGIAETGTERSPL
jgi:hypothetical protein